MGSIIQQLNFCDQGLHFSLECGTPDEMRHHFAIWQDKANKMILDSIAVPLLTNPNYSETSKFV